MFVCISPAAVTVSLCLSLSCQLKVRQTGVNVQKFVPGLQAPDATLNQFYTIVHPQVDVYFISLLQLSLVFPWCSGQVIDDGVVPTENSGYWRAAAMWCQLPFQD